MPENLCGVPEIWISKSFSFTDCLNCSMPAGILTSSCWCCSCRCVRLILNRGHQRAYFSFPTYYVSYGGMILMILTGEQHISDKNLSKCHFVHHRAHMDWPGHKAGPLLEYLLRPHSFLTLHFVKVLKNVFTLIRTISCSSPMIFNCVFGNLGHLNG
jgi:hypothetical protein